MAQQRDLWLSTPEQEGQSRQQRRRDRKVNDIMAFTALTVAEHGYHMTSLDDIAEHLDLSKASIYHYFNGKEALVLATLESCSDYSFQELTAVLNKGGTPTERLQGLIRRHIQMTSIENVEMSRLFLQPLDWPPTIAESVLQRNREHVAMFRDVIQEGIDSGEFEAGDARVANMSIQGAMMLAPVWYGKQLRGRGGAAVLDRLVRSLMLLVVPAKAAASA
ncbi:TetR/AcrR family transcriptional regulator [Herbiconiux ginsengi]|uniref:Transcriptional regulator, TetR family n=1 Tax=Herbiconiux ginsengi TaxID=381665 RepID=A0A1H3TFZ4_9MICO|nr:TetR/AcrR family transcriptional regulator [Herbiconiux ginsengi]SDZ48867.1 transcriptional regulator, TetR family [Herbiconiux ginsengi]